jgi:phospholipid-transporting ATPase
LTSPPERLAGAVIRSERPNRNIYGFQENLELEGKTRRIPLGPSNIMLRGCELKNTAWAVGVVVYAGRETKAMLNNAAPKKRSRLETHMNREMLFLSAILVVLCSIVAALSAILQFDYSGIARQRPPGSSISLIPSILLIRRAVVGN